MRKSTIYLYALMYCRQQLKAATKANSTAQRSIFAKKAEKKKAKNRLHRLLGEEATLCELLNAAKRAEAAESFLVYD